MLLIYFLTKFLYSFIAMIMFIYFVECAIFFYYKLYIFMFIIFSNTHILLVKPILNMVKIHFSSFSICRYILNSIGKYVYFHFMWLI